MATRRITRNQGRRKPGPGSPPAPSSGQELSDTPNPLIRKTLISQPLISFIICFSTLSRKSTRLSKSDSNLLLKKQQLLRTSTAQTLATLEPRLVHLGHNLSATLVFAQPEAGTAFCISPTGLLLTCSHCVSEDPAELEENRVKWLLFACGRVVQSKCIVYDHKRDLALLQIIVAEQEPKSALGAPIDGPEFQETSWTSFPFLAISPDEPKKNVPIVCIGHPGDEDLEASKPGVKTNYDVLHISSGRYRGISEGADVHDNSEIGALMHDCWTYWGHSGAPLIGKRDGLVVGMHSSWDDETGMRRGIAWESILSFLEENGNPHIAGDTAAEILGSEKVPILVE
ncbi:hypothetical protein TWF730_010247 [Orbilia blumenaviensis]|uniref:AT hook domain-containing protein family protein n=1 Tax=Orbilia blumenaviensis TaxID=1796055 RepID=A0AAV9UNH7_9PEZI